MLACPIFRLTWYPGEYPSATGGVVLQSPDHLAEGYAALAAKVMDRIQTAEPLRGSAPVFFNRGNRRADFQWTEVREYDDPSLALVEGLAAVAAMPSETGWLRIDVVPQSRSFTAIPCMIEAAAMPVVERAGAAHLLRLQWTLLCGPIEEIPGALPDDYFVLEDDFAMLLEDGAFFALESAT
jgi:hypothetical protein